MLLFAETALITLSAKNLDAMNGFEKVFIVFAAAFALEEYTASKEHGWTSKLFPHSFRPFILIVRYSIHR